VLPRGGIVVRRIVASIRYRSCRDGFESFMPDSSLPVPDSSLLSVERLTQGMSAATLPATKAATHFRA
jgi:hypothetical protein